MIVHAVQIRSCDQYKRFTAQLAVEFLGSTGANGTGSRPATSNTGQLNRDAAAAID